MPSRSILAFTAPVLCALCTACAHPQRRAAYPPHLAVDEAVPDGPDLLLTGSYQLPLPKLTAATSARIPDRAAFLARLAPDGALRFFLPIEAERIALRPEVQKDGSIRLRDTFWSGKMKIGSLQLFGVKDAPASFEALVDRNGVVRRLARTDEGPAWRRRPFTILDPAHASFSALFCHPRMTGGRPVLDPRFARLRAYGYWETDSQGGVLATWKGPEGSAMVIGRARPSGMFFDFGRIRDPLAEKHTEEGVDEELVLAVLPPNGATPWAAMLLPAPDAAAFDAQGRGVITIDPGHGSAAPLEALGGTIQTWMGHRFVRLPPPAELVTHRAPGFVAYEPGDGPPWRTIRPIQAVDLGLRFQDGEKVQLDRRGDSVRVITSVRRPASPFYGIQGIRMVRFVPGGPPSVESVPLPAKPMKFYYFNRDELWSLARQKGFRPADADEVSSVDLDLDGVEEPVLVRSRKLPSGDYQLVMRLWWKGRRQTIDFPPTPSEDDAVGFCPQHAGVPPRMFETVSPKRGSKGETALRVFELKKGRLSLLQTLHPPKGARHDFPNRIFCGGDYDGDGIRDLIVTDEGSDERRTDESNEDTRPEHAYLYLDADLRRGRPSQTLPLPLSAGDDMESNQFVSVGDVNSDGRDDLLVGPIGHLRLYHGSPKGLVFSTIFHIDDVGFQDLLPMDVTGDGVKELVNLTTDRRCKNPSDFMLEVYRLGGRDEN